MTTDNEKKFLMYIQQMEGMVKSPEAKARIRELAPQIQEELSKMESHVPVEIQVAEVLHDAFCHYNHADGCSWEYEKWEDAYEMVDGKMRVSKSTGVRAGYLRRAVAMIGKFKSGTFPRDPEKEKMERDSSVYVFDMSRIGDRALVELVKVILGVEDES